MGVMRVLNIKGDTETRWDPNSKISTMKASAVFEVNKRLGLVAYKVDEHGVGSEQIKAFDPEAHEIIFTRQHVGG